MIAFYSFEINEFKIGISFTDTYFEQMLANDHLEQSVICVNYIH